MKPELRFPKPGNAFVSHGIRLLLFAGCVGIALLPLIMPEALSEIPLRALCLLSSAAAIFVLAAVAVSSRRGAYSLAAVYGLVFAAFHFGLSGSYALGYDIVKSGADPWAYLWFMDTMTPRAILLAVSGMGGFGVGVIVHTLQRPNAAPSGPEWLEDFRGDRLGFAVLAASILGWFAMVLASGGAVLLVASYGDFLASTRGMPLMFVDFGVGIGMALLFTGEGGPLRRAGVALFALWSLVAFPLGLRGDVLFPLAGAIAIASMRRPPMRLSRLVLLAFGVLLATTVARQLRQVGLFGMEGGGFSVNPLDALAEMGSSLRPVHIVLGWAENGDAPLLGVSYWAPFERILHYLAPLWERVASTEDTRLLNVLVQDRVGQVGFSPVAEAYVNFRAAGPALVMAATGALLGWIDRLPATRANQLLAAALVVPIILQVRNAFSQVPGQVLAGYLVLAAGVLLRTLWRRLHARGEATA